MEKNGTIDRGEAYVDFVIPRGGIDERAVLIGVNGEFVRVQPGETVRVKRKFVEAWEHARQQEREAWKAQVKAQEAGRRALAEL